jgi:SAM-dependent methyltransferase
MLSNLLAKQLSRPSEVLGQLLLAPLWNRRNRALNDITLQHLNLQSNDHVLEVGFGGGYLLGKMLPIVTQGSLAGVDISRAMVSFCEKRYRTLIQSKKLELRLAQAEQLPYAADCFTKVCSVNSIFYWSDARYAIGEVWRVLRTEGLLVLCFTSKESLASRSFAKHGLTLYEQNEVVEMMKSAGFRQINVQRARDRYRTFYCIAGTK